MLIRKCAKGHKVYIFKPRTKENVTYKFSDETISFDAQNKSYIVVSDGAVVKRTDSWITAQSAFFKEAEDEIEKMEVGKHKLENGIVVEL